MTDRIASLIPSGTDIVAALGLAERLVGVSHECDHPIAEGKPVLTSSTIVQGMSAAKIDAAVGASVSEGQSLYTTHRELLHALSPSIVLSQEICDVCAVNGELVRGEVPPGAELVMLTAVRLADLWQDLRHVAEAADAPQRAEPLIAEVRARLDAVAQSTSGQPVRRVALLEWGDPLFLAGHWVPELLDHAGGEDVFGMHGRASRRATADEVAEADPDVVLFLPCGYGLAQAAREAEALVAGPLAGIRAVEAREVWALDASRLFSRCTPQSVTAGATTLASVLHPDIAGPPGRTRARRVAMPPG